jgi:hypothetical protein
MYPFITMVVFDEALAVISPKGEILVCPPSLLVGSVRHRETVSKTLATIYGNG